MSKLVVDSSVAIKWFVDEDDSDQAHMLLDRIAAGDYTLIVPELIYAEVGNIIWKKVMRGALTPSDGNIIANIFFEADIGLEVVPTIPLFLEASNLAISYKQSMYDSIYLALSIREQCSVVTADERLFNSVGASLPNVVLLANWF
jgi:predicted nucleic acid-binding protein